jgi:hypothetical protein
MQTISNSSRKILKTSTILPSHAFLVIKMIISSKRMIQSLPQKKYPSLIAFSMLKDSIGLKISKISKMD